eukprot:TRINITY_DN11629_c1_g1_i1.p1 TRINITY_DN11629_c1_g1~~TRINITY_DN11629_c1_g1_i1.p1  ORF type:complete len:234 (+),score=54.14 TRINITY_DN11629_c1_g1_i1:141-842(+)
MSSRHTKSSSLLRLLGLGVFAGVAWRSVCSDTFVSGPATHRLGLGSAVRTGVSSSEAFGYDSTDQPVRAAAVVLHAAKKKAAGGDKIMHGDTVYIKVQTGRYIGELDGTTKIEWVKARGTKKDKAHALTIEKVGDTSEPIKNGDTVMLVMPTGVHVDVLGSAVRARYYDPRGQWQRLTIVKQDGGEILSGDKFFLRAHQGEYLDANPLERAPDGEVKARWRDEGEWQVMTIEK